MFVVSSTSKSLHTSEITLDSKFVRALSALSVLLTPWRLAVVWLALSAASRKLFGT